MKKPYIVILEQVCTHTYTVDDCNSPEEAEGIATHYLEDGEEGIKEVIDTRPVDSFAEEEIPVDDRDM